MTSGFNLYAPTFVAIGGEGLNLQDIKIVDAANDLTENVSILNAGGNIESTYYWLDGWINEDGDLVEDVIVTPGQGFYIYESLATAKIQVAGSVKLDPVKYPLSAGYNLVGNATPVDIDFQSAVLANAESDLTENVSILTAEGNIKDTYYWFDGWINEDGDPIEDVKLLAGDGLYIFVGKEGVEFKLPQAIAK